MLTIFAFAAFICGINTQMINQPGFNQGFPNQQFGQMPNQQFGQLPNQQFGQFPNQQFGQQGILGQPGFQNQIPGQINGQRLPGQIPGQVLPGQIPGQQPFLGQNFQGQMIPGQVLPGQVGFNNVNNLAQNRQFLQQNVGNPNSCHVRGCGMGQQCVYRSNVGLPFICPTWIPILPCQCVPGCRAQNQYIQVGQTKQIDTCGNRCTCNTQSGQASCTQIACNQPSPGTQPQTIGRKKK